MSGALPGALTAFGLSLAEAQTTAGSCSIWLDLSPGQLLLPSGQAGVFNADANGQATLSFPIPNLPAVVGAAFFAQWISADPAGLFPAWGANWRLSNSRRVLIW